MEFESCIICYFFFNSWTIATGYIYFYRNSRLRIPACIHLRTNNELLRLRILRPKWWWILFFAWRVRAGGRWIVVKAVRALDFDLKVCKFSQRYLTRSCSSGSAEGHTLMPCSDSEFLSQCINQHEWITYLAFEYIDLLNLFCSDSIPITLLEKLPEMRDCFFAVRDSLSEWIIIFVLRLAFEDFRSCGIDIWANLFW